MNKDNHNRSKKSCSTYNSKGNLMKNNQLHKYHKKYNSNTNNYVKKKNPNKVNLQFFSFKILEAKHNSTPELYIKKNLNNLILKRKCHLLSMLNEIAIDTNFLREFIKRFYTYEESKERIPKYVSYYKNYLLFFCRPVFSDLACNRRMVKHMERIAQIFYNENYAEDENKELIELKEKSSLHQKNEHISPNFVIFNQEVKQDIENCEKFTDTSANNDKNDDNKTLCKDDYLLLLEKEYKITPIYTNTDKNGDIKIKKTTINISDNNSFDLLIKELEKTKKESKNKKPKQNNFNSNSNFYNSNNNNNINNNSVMVIDYFNNISKIIFNKKSKNNSLKNNKKILHKSLKYSSSFKKKNTYNKITKDQINNINTNSHSKIINNINININQLTIGQKTININKNHNFMKKNNSKKAYQKIINNNSNKDNNNNYLLNKNIFIGYLTNKNKNISLGLPSPANIFPTKYNYLNKRSCLNIYKKQPLSNYNSNNLSLYNNHINTRNKSVLKIGDNNKGYSASLNNYKKTLKKNISINNDGSHLNSMYNLLNNNRTTKKNIKINNYNNSFYKKNFSMCSSFSPLINKQNYFSYNNKKKKYCHLSSNNIKIQDNKKLYHKKFIADENSIIKDTYHHSSSINDKTFHKKNKNDSSIFRNHMWECKKINYKKIFKTKKWINSMSKNKINKNLRRRFSGKKEIMKKNKSCSKFNK